MKTAGQGRQAGQSRPRKGAGQAGQAGKGGGAGLPQRGGVIAGGIVAEGVAGVAAEHAPAFQIRLAAMAWRTKRLEKVSPEGLRPVCLPREYVIHHFGGG